jgi:NO-binding membrane sensor protein with MHYT domain
MTGYYNLQLVALSLAIAILASYAALDLASRVSQEGMPRRAWAWLIAGAVSMGTGIWSMHFIGMLAFHLPIPVAYDVPTTAFSMLVAIAVSATALLVLRRPQVTTEQLLVGAVLMGAGIVGMHYTGMAALRMSPPIRYDPLLFATSVIIAAAASVAALWIALRVRHLSRYAIPAKLLSAGVMGLAITGMHYTGMAAARFAPGSMCLTAAAGYGFSNTALALIVGCIAFGIMSLTIVLSTLDGHFAARNQQLAHSLQLAKEAAEAALQRNQRITAELSAAQERLVNSARQAGMAEIANSVLHNVGNVLNSVTVSAGLMHERLRESKLAGLTQALELIQANLGNLGDFLARDPRGGRLLPYLGQLARTLQEEQDMALEELRSLTRSIEHIQEVVATQQSYAGAISLVQPVRLEELIEDALRMSGIARRGITVVKELLPLPLLLVDRHLILQVLVNLLANARQATEALAGGAHQVRVAVELAGPANSQRVRIHVADDGEGIAAENLRRLFTHGFTTRKAGHGFGLHSSYLAAQSIGGTLTAHSDGQGRGAVFTLELPLKAAEQAA